MKYIVFLCDGMADYPVDALGKKTPLEVAKNPNMNELAKRGEIGLCKTVSDHLSPGSDIANLSVLGYDPDVFYTGRSPLEALSIGVNLQGSDVTFRANIVTLSDEEAFEDKTMLDYSSGEITTREAHELINYLKENMHFDDVELYGGTSYRHLIVWNGASTDVTLTPPHDISDKRVTEYLPKGKGSDVLLDIMKKSHKLLSGHPINKDRIARGLNPANSLWIWGEGTKPQLTAFYEKYGVSATMISAVDLLKGIGVGAKMDVLYVEGATGNLDTNFEGKAKAAIDALKNGTDLVYIHIEAPDECGHHGDTDGKIRSVELIDDLVIKPVVKYLKQSGEDFRVLITPDHPTPLALKTHVRDAVPFVIYDSRYDTGLNLDYTEEKAKSTGLYINPGHKLMKVLLEK